MACEPKLRWDSPVYKFIDRLTPPSVAEEVKQAVAAAVSEASPSPAASSRSAGVGAPAHSELMERVEEAQKKGDWLKAKMLLEEIREMRRTGTVETSADQQVETRKIPMFSSGSRSPRIRASIPLRKKR